MSATSDLTIYQIAEGMVDMVSSEAVRHLREHGQLFNHPLGIAR